MYSFMMLIITGWRHHIINGKLTFKHTKTNYTTSKLPYISCNILYFISDQRQVGIQVDGWVNSVHRPCKLYVDQTCQLPRVSRESHGFLQFLQSHGRGNSCSRVYSCPTVLFSHRLLPIIIAGNTSWQHKFSVT